MAKSSDGAGRLTTHVLDTSRGRPAAGLAVALFRLEGEGRELVTTARTNADGRCDAPLLEGASFSKGRYELVFDAGPYLDETAGVANKPRFLEDVVIRFGISQDAHYQVPLLLSPFGYSTYRGS